MHVGVLYEAGRMMWYFSVVQLDLKGEGGSIDICTHKETVCSGSQ